MNKNLNHKVDPDFNCIKYVKSFRENKFSKHKYNDHIVRADLCPVLISILFNTNNIDTAVFSIKKFLEKSRNPEKIQFCIKVDNTGDFTKKFLEKIKKLPCNFIILSSPQGRGYLDLWQWINYLYKVSSRKSKFVMNISDEMFVDQNNWDIILKSFENYKEDKIFRLRTSVFKNRNYKALFECGYAPDTTAIYSKKYLHIQGDFSPCFGPDNGQQFVAYYLATLNYPRHYQFSRDFVVEALSFSGQGTNKGIEGKARNYRIAINYLLWQNMFKAEYQTLYFQRARKLQLAILTYSFPKLKIYHNSLKERYEVSYLDKDNVFVALNLSYKISRIKNLIENISTYNYFKFHTGVDKSILKGLAVHFYIVIFKTIPNYQKIELYEKQYNLKTTIDSLNRVLTRSRELLLFSRIARNSKLIKFIITIYNYSKLKAYISELKITEFTSFIINLIIMLIAFTITIHRLKNNLIFINNKYKFIPLPKKSSIVLLDDGLDQSKTVVVKGN